MGCPLLEYENYFYLTSMSFWVRFVNETTITIGVVCRSAFCVVSVSCFTYSLHILTRHCTCSRLKICTTIVFTRYSPVCPDCLFMSRSSCQYEMAARSSLEVNLRIWSRFLFAPDVPHQSPHQNQRSFCKKHLIASGNHPPRSTFSTLRTFWSAWHRSKHSAFQSLEKASNRCFDSLIRPEWWLLINGNPGTIGFDVSLCPMTILTIFNFRLYLWSSRYSSILVSLL